MSAPGPNPLQGAWRQLLQQLPDPVSDPGVTPGPFSENQLPWSREGSQSRHVFCLSAVCAGIGSGLDQWWKADQQIKVGS